VLIGHSGSTSAHPTVVQLTRAIRAENPAVRIIYGGVYPTFHWHDILQSEPQIDYIVRGEGEQTLVRLVNALENEEDPATIPGIAYREPILTRSQSSPDIRATPLPPPIANLDTCRVGWELIDPTKYSYWGNKRAVVAQFSRGCPHHCHYCGQRGFWRQWRHRDPVRFAAELAWLHRTHGVEVINFADENPTASREAWKAFLEALIRENVALTLVGSTRADDIVRDADLLPLYKKAGVARFLLGMESTDEATLQKIRKDSRESTDREAIRLLRQNGILSMAAYVSGFEDETDADYFRTLTRIISYDPDQIQAVFATPHRWTPMFQQEKHRRVVQTDLRLWDYKHQVLQTRHMPPWRVLLWTKLIEAAVQLRPKSLWRVLAHSDPKLRAAMRWYYRIGRRVWPHELWRFVFKDTRTSSGPTLEQFMSPPPPQPASIREPAQEPVHA
jgi:anaerobic magnesium-protoporphyrin IX monomethyl ester cyclase